MNRRDFLRRSALITAGIVAADQIELLEKLSWKRTMFPAGGYTPGGIWLVRYRDKVTGQLIFSDEALRLSFGETWEDNRWEDGTFVRGNSTHHVVNVNSFEPKRLVTGRNAATGELHRL